MQLALPAAFLIIIFYSLYGDGPSFSQSRQSARATFERAKVLTQGGRFFQALKYVEELNRQFPSNHVYWAQAADLHRRLGQSAAEAAALERIMIHSSAPDEVCPRLGQVYEEIGDNAKMLDALSRCLKLDANNSDFHFFMGHAHEKVGDIESAEKEFDFCLGRSPQYLDCTVGKARMELRKGNPEGALQVLRSVADARVEASSDALFVRALAKRRLGEAELSKLDLQRAAELSPGNNEVISELNLLESTGQ